MASEKRERQRANREKKQQDRQRRASRDLNKDRAMLIALVAVAITAAMALWFFYREEAPPDPNELTETTEVILETPEEG